MSKPTMFSNPVKKYRSYPVYIMANIDTDKNYISDVCPKHYLIKESCDFMIQVLGISKTYRTIQVSYNPNEGIYEECEY